MTLDVWAVGGAYESYVGRWSRLVATSLLRWLAVPAGREWLDVGCGTGTLAATVLACADPASVVGVDPSAGFVAYARTQVTDPRARFLRGDARCLPLARGRLDAAVSGLVLNFVPQPARAVAELARVTKPGGTVAAYVWDYADGMALIRDFWAAAGTLDAAAAELDEGIRFPLCQPQPLEELWHRAGLAEVSVRPIEVPTVFRDFDDYWTPFLGGQGPAPGYAMSLSEQDRSRLRELLRTRLPAEPDGSIRLTARAWAVRGRR